MIRVRNIGNLVLSIVITSLAHGAPVHLRCESLQNPLGIDSAVPRLSWQSDNPERNWRQSAYQIIVATSPAHLDADRGDVWDSGKVNSSESIGIAYAGPRLESHTRYYWKVRVWDSSGKAAQSEMAWWEMGLLKKEDWKAKWITWTNPEEARDRSGIRWIWVAGQDALAMTPDVSATFRTEINLPDKPGEAVLFLLARGNFIVSVNGHEVGRKQHWNSFDREDIDGELVSGKNVIEVSVTVPKPNRHRPGADAKTMTAGLAALLKITRVDGSVVRVVTNSDWKGRLSTDSEWQSADVIGDLNDQRMGSVPPLPQPAALLRRNFTLSRPVKDARLYVTALGSYRIFLNGRRVGNDVLTPDFTDYAKRVLYQTYDVSEWLVAGRNAMAALLGEGWFGSGLTWEGLSYFFLPPPPRLLAQLEITYQDGTRETVVSDEKWIGSASPILRSEIYAGEVYDARHEQPGWDQATFDDSRWTSTATVAGEPAILVSSQIDAPARVTEKLAPKSVSASANGSYVFDMGQNMVGWVALTATGAAGTAIRLRFAERLNPDGGIYRQNLRNADATDLFILRGNGEETFRPHFTFHGFRYVEVTGYPGVPTTASITGEVVSSLRGEPTATLNTSSALVNRMWSIGIWGQRGNFLSVPTDCPQRDERLGWMGDAGVFWRTGSYNFDIDPFSHKFMNDVADAQTAQGAFTNVSPDILRPYDSEGAPGWGDAGVIIPWTTWIQYGDQSIIEEYWSSMVRWMDFIAKANPDFLRKKGVGPNFADWLAPDEHTNKDLLATAYWALIADMMSQMAHALGKESEAKRYEELIANIRNAYQKAYIKEDGSVEGGTQTSYVVTLYTKMAPPALEPSIMKHLVADIEKRDWHLSTGFLGTPFLLFTLANHGRADVAYRLLLNETYPSWGYMLSKGATTWWERWNGDTGDPSMNSYNHYAFGSVVAWVYRSVVGIDTTTAAPGYKQIVIRPHLDARITRAHGEYESVYGKIVSDWTGTPSGPFLLHVTIPANTTARIFLPSIPNAHVLQDGKPISTGREADTYSVNIGSGKYTFEVR